MARVLLLHLGFGGHYTAARAVEAGLRRLNPSVETRCVDPIQYAHPYFSRIIHQTYMVMLRQTPEVWEAMYDSARLDALTRRVRWLIQRGNSRGFLRMLDEFNPDAVVCTQAYTYGLMCAHLRGTGVDLPLFGVITDYRPHRFWVFDGYGGGHLFAPTGEARERLVRLGVAAGRVTVSGIPIGRAPDRERAVRPGLAGSVRRVLAMGGSMGLGVSYGLIRELDRCREPFALDVVAGTNRKLRGRVARARGGFEHPVRLRGIVGHVPELMRRSALLVSKPGGLTCAEAMAAGLPMMIVRPLPGQEAGNTQHLVGRGAALLVEKEREIPAIVDTLFRNRELLEIMSQRALSLGVPDAADVIAKAVAASLPG